MSTLGWPLCLMPSCSKFGKDGGGGGVSSDVDVELPSPKDFVVLVVGRRAATSGWSAMDVVVICASFTRRGDLSSSSQRGNPEIGRPAEVSSS